MNTEIKQQIKSIKTNDVSTMDEILIWLTYLYIVFISVVSVIWYASNDYVPPIIWYQYYPVAGVAGSFIALKLSPRIRNAMYTIMAVFGIWGFITNLMAGIVLTAAPVSNTTDLFEGTYQYPLMGNPNTFTVIAKVNADNTVIISNNNNGYFLIQYTLDWINAILLGMIGFVVGVVKLSQWNKPKQPDELKTKDIRQISAKELFVTGPKFRVALSYFSFVLVCFIGVYVVLTILIFADGALPIALYQNEHCWLLMMAVISLLPPEGISVIDSTNEKKRREFGFWYAKHVGGVHGSQLFWLLGLSFSLAFSFYATSTTSWWRTNDNELPSIGLCTGTAYDPLFNVTGTTLTQKPLQYFKLLGTPPINKVYYRPNSNTKYVNLLYATCFNDAMTIMIPILGTIVWVFAIVVTAYPPETKEDEIELEEFEQDLTDHDKTEAANDLNDIKIQEDNIKKGASLPSGIQGSMKDSVKRRKIYSKFYNRTGISNPIKSPITLQ